MIPQDAVHHCAHAKATIASPPPEHLPFEHEPFVHEPLSHWTEPAHGSPAGIDRRLARASGVCIFRSANAAALRTRGMGSVTNCSTTGTSVSSPV
jgi:hypothetical protein